MFEKLSQADEAESERAVNRRRRVFSNMRMRTLIPFATHAFVFQCQVCTSVLPSLLAFPMISTDFTPTP